MARPYRGPTAARPLEGVSLRTKELAVLAVLALAFVGFAVMADESDAAVTSTVSYHVEDKTIIVPSGGEATMVLATLEDLGAKVPADRHFVGWKIGDVTYNAGSTYVLGEDDPEPVAVFAATEYSALFFDDEGSLLCDPIEGYVVDDEGNPVDPVDLATVMGELIESGAVTVDRDGFIFLGWLEAGAVAPVATADLGSLTGDAIYVAAYMPDYTVTFIDGDKTYTTHVADLKVPDVGIKTGFTFVGWFIGDVKVDPADYDYTADTTFIAVWAPVNCTVTYIAGGDIVASVPVYYGERAIEPKTPAGYKAWDFDFTVPITSDVTIQAIPDEIVPIYDLIYIVDGIVIFEATTASAVTVPTDPVKEGFVFTGWLPSIDVPVTEDTVYTAVFSPEILSVTFMTGEEIYSETSVKFGTVVTEPKLPEGYIAWAFDFSTPITADTVVEAIAEPVVPIYTLTYYVDGVKVFETTTDAEVTVPTDPVKEGYAFVGWDPEAGLPVTHDTVYNAIFAPDVLSVTFVAGGDAVFEESVKYGECAIEPKLPEGFAAWDFDFATPIVEDTVIHAVETPIVPVYKLTYIVDGVIILETTTASAVTVPTDPVKTGYTFLGWNPAVGDVTEDTVYVAQFRADTFSVAFVAGGKEVAKSTVEYGNTVPAPAVPEGYAGWDFDFSTKIYKDTVVKAKEFTYTVTFVAGKTVVKTMSVVSGTVLTEDDMPETVAGFRPFAVPADPIIADTEIRAAALPGTGLADPMVQISILAAIILILAFVAFFIKKVRGGDWIIGTRKKLENKGGEQ